jgi:lipopolysaccharide/colanic/teichoic acid biosynthesis glycosyltransferase
MATRILDIFVAIIGLIIMLPLLPIIAFFIKADSKGPFFYKCDRIGLNGKIFKIYKLRTMYETPEQVGQNLSPLGDPRVTAVGRVLRRLKLNEYPQFFNILKGDMTLIGPRPEAPDLAQAYPEYARRIFSVKPGLVGPNQIQGRNEEELYPPGVDPSQFYIEHILPRKIALDLEYIDNKSFWEDLKYILLAVKVIITGAISKRHLLDNQSQLLLLISDVCLCLVSFTFAHFIRFETGRNPELTAMFFKILPWAVLVRLPIFIYFGFYHTLIRHLSLYDFKQVFKGVTLSSGVLISVCFLLGYVQEYSRGAFLIDWFGLAILLIGYRECLKKLYLRYVGHNGAQGDKINTLIWGAGDGGELCLRYLQKEQNPAYEVIGFIDDDHQKRGKKIGGVRILGDRHHLDIVSRLYKIKEVFVAIPSAPFFEMENILNFCKDLGLKAELFLTKANANSGPHFEPASYSQAHDFSKNAEIEPTAHRSAKQI